MQSTPKKEEKRIQDYLPDNWPEVIQSEARLAGHKTGISIPTIKRVVYNRKVKHKLWPLVWQHVQKNKEMEDQMYEILKPVA